ncbi:MAG TPA: gas vesicle protein K [Ktedonobacterales bacterium]
MTTDDLDASLASMRRLDGDLDSLREFAGQYAQVNAGLPRRINADQSNVEQGLAKLVLTLIELIRQLLERQALRRIEGGSLSEDQIERLGETFMKLEHKMEELKETFGLSDEDLNLNLGPLGDLM